MKATDLMIGDWVQFFYRHPETDERVVRVFQVTQIEAQLGDYYVWSKDGRVCHPERLLPIPLTPEILKKNGWYYKKGLNSWINYKAVMLIETVAGSGVYRLAGCYNPAIYTNTVHELQHALRFRGIKKEIEL